MADFNLTSPPEGFVDNPYPVYRALLENSPVHAQPDGTKVITRYADLDMIYRDTKRFISDKKAVFGPKFGVESALFEHHTNSLVFNDPPLHTRVRSVMVGALNPRALAHLEPNLVTLVDRLLDEMADLAQVDLIKHFAAAIPVEVIGNMLGIPLDQRGPLRDWSLAILGALEPSLTDEQMVAGNASVLEFKDFLKRIVADRREHPGDPETDVLTRLIQSEAGQLSEIELLQNCIFILNAGHETTTNLIGNSLSALDAFPEARQQLIDSPEIIATAVDEFLRFESPNQFGNRLTTEEFTLHGVVIPAGTDLHLCIGAANRDPGKFDTPHQLQLDRRPNKHLAFAGGAHTCVGLSVARMEGRIAVGRFLKRYPGFSLNGPGKRGGRIRFRGFANLPARLS